MLIKQNLNMKSNRTSFDQFIQIMQELEKHFYSGQSSGNQSLEHIEISEKDSEPKPSSKQDYLPP